MGKTGKAMGQNPVKSSEGVSRADLNKQSVALARLLSMKLALPKRPQIPPPDLSGKMVPYFSVCARRRYTLAELRVEISRCHRALSKAGFKVRWTELGGAS